MSETKIMGLPGGGRWVLVDDGRGMGGGDLPADHPMRRWFVAEYRGSRSLGYETALSLDYAAEAEWVPARVRAAAARRLDSRVPFTNPNRRTAS